MRGETRAWCSWFGLFANGGGTSHLVGWTERGDDGLQSVLLGLTKGKGGGRASDSIELNTGEVDGTFHSPEWHAARLASLNKSHTVTWEEFKRKQKHRRSSDSSSNYSASESLSSDDDEKESRRLRLKTRSKGAKKDKKHRSKSKHCSSGREESDGPILLSTFFESVKS